MKARIRALIVLSVVALHPISIRGQAETIDFCQAPNPLPRGQELTTYSPALCFAYSGLLQDTYSFRVHLLETTNYFCANDHQWCGENSDPPAVFVIDNLNGTNHSGTRIVVRNMDVYDYPDFLWVVDLYNGSNQKVATGTLPAASTALRPPVLNTIGNKSGFVGQPLQFSVSATAPAGSTATLNAQNLPAGATFDLATGIFTWPSPVAGVFTGLLFEARLQPNVLNDAELVTIQIESKKMRSQITSQ